MTKSGHILVVDDEADLRELLRNLLVPEGFTISLAESGRAMRRILRARDIDLIILDLGLPDEDGLSLTKELRGVSDIPVIILTGKGDEVDKVLGLELGADDYIVKPFPPRELLARVRTVLRRTGRSRPGPAEGAAVRPGNSLPIAAFRGWRLDTAARELYTPSGSLVHLTSVEFELLAALVRSPNTVLSRTHLLRICSGREWSPYDRSVDIHIGRLRSKIEPDPKAPSFIKTVRGTGYVFTAPVELKSRLPNPGTVGPTGDDVARGEPERALPELI